MSLDTMQKNQTTTPPKNKKKPYPWYRTAIQALFFFLVAAISVNGLLIARGIKVPFLSTASLHAICPFGGVVSIYKFATVGTFVQKIHESSFILMILAFLLAVFFGPVICGWVCPLGTFQEWISKIGRKIFGKKFNRFIPYSIDRYLRFIRYIILALVIYLTVSTTKLVFQDADPYFALFNFWSDEIAMSALIILGVTILFSLFVERPWCKYACPYGAFLGIFNLFRVFKIRRKDTTCINCKRCDKICPMNIPVSTKDVVLNHQCISCLQCTSEDQCPVDETINFSVKGGKTNEN